MKNLSTLLRGFQDATDILASSARENCVVVRPATAAEFVDEFRVLTEKEYQRLLRVGLRLTPGADVKELFCFRYVPSYDELTVRVLRLVQEPQIRTRRSEGKPQVWKVEQTPMWSKRRTEVDKQILLDKTGSGELGSESTAGGIPLHCAKLVSDFKERKRGRREEESCDDLGDLSAGSKGAIDELHPPKKIRRLNGDRKKRSAVLDSLPESHDNGANTKWSDGGEVEHPQFVTVVKDRNSSNSSSPTADNISEGKSDTSSAVQSDEEEEDSDRLSFTDRSENANLFSMLQKVVAAGMCVDTDDNLGPYTHDQAIFQPTSTAAVLNWTRSVVGSAATRVHTLLNKIRGSTDQG
ncbi:hypothetical protein V7S43_000555 [Phytophthora oleae]|uniref:Uncharacterized protein n=1 Tax=Phytophthora oleae TaxID=2107226 RepID=A0ABD3G620_9STRA